MPPAAVLSGDAAADLATLQDENQLLRQRLEAALARIEEADKRQASLERVAGDLDHYVNKLKNIIR
jgi:cell division septum initiation protein DivIVA